MSTPWVGHRASSCSPLTSLVPRVCPLWEWIPRLGSDTQESRMLQTVCQRSPVWDVPVQDPRRSHSAQATFGEAIGSVQQSVR